MVAAFVSHLEDNDFACHHDELNRSLSIQAGSGGSKRALRYRLFNESDAAIENVEANDSYEALVSLPPITDRERTEFDRQGIMWIDIDASESGSWNSDLGEEFIQFLKIYGVRVTEIPESRAAIPVAASSVADRSIKRRIFGRVPETRYSNIMKTTRHD